MNDAPAPLDPLALLRDAVAIPSVSGEEAAVADFLVDAMAPWCDEAFVDEAGNAVGRWGSGPLQIVVLGHIDTEPGTIPVRVEGGELWGRGSVDAKGAFCTAVSAASRLPDAFREALTIRLVGAVEEEAPTSAGARHAVETYPRPDLVIIGEPSGWDAVTLGYKGRLVAKLRSEVPNAHSAGPEASAAERAVEGWIAVRDWAAAASDEAAGVFDAVQATLQDIRSQTDGLTQRAEATVGLRLPPAWAPPDAAAAIRTALPEGLAVVFTGSEAAYRGPRDTPLTRAFRVAIRAEGGRPRTKVKTGTSDMNVVAPEWDVPMLAYGPGDSRLDHAPDERVPVDELERAVRVLAGAFEHLVDAEAAAG